MGCLYYYWLINIFFSIGDCRIGEDQAFTLLGEISYNWIKEFPLCLAESKWMTCHMIFRECTYNKSTNSSSYLPPCQETCDLYIRRTKACNKTLLPLIHGFQQKNSCAGNLFNLECSLYPKRLSGKCQDIPFGKHIYFVKMICVRLLCRFKINFEVLCIYQKLPLKLALPYLITLSTYSTNYG